MPSVKSIKQRIKSTKNTAQITKAMEMVSAAKMRKSQEAALGGRPYAGAVLRLVKNILLKFEEKPEIILEREVKTKLILIVTSDKGLAGALNSNVLKATDSWFKKEEANKKSLLAMAIGKKALEYCNRNGIKVAQSFTGFGDRANITETLTISDAILAGFLEKKWDEVDVVYTQFRTTLLQEVKIRKILPVTIDNLVEVVKSITPEYGKFAESNKNMIEKEADNYLYEPSAKEVLEVLFPQLLAIHVHNVILEANASEHSARMVAMKSASDNAKKLVTDLTLVYNKARQSNITREILEITAGAEALQT